jgi:hypothetical protein
MVARIVKKHHDHPAIDAGRSIIRSTLAEAMENPARSPAHRELARIAQAGTSPEVILIEAAAVFLFARGNPHTLPDDVRLTSAMGYAASLLAPRQCTRTQRTRTGATRRHYREVPGAVRRALGGWLRTELSPLLANLLIAAEATAALQMRRREAMRTLIVNTTTTTTTKDRQQ